MGFPYISFFLIEIRLSKSKKFDMMYSFPPLREIRHFRIDPDRAESGLMAWRNTTGANQGAKRTEFNLGMFSGLQTPARGPTVFL